MLRRHRAVAYADEYLSAFATLTSAYKQIQPNRPEALLVRRPDSAMGRARCQYRQLALSPASREFASRSSPVLESASYSAVGARVRISSAASGVPSVGKCCIYSWIADYESRHHGRRARRAPEAAHPDLPQAVAPGRQPVGPPDPD